MVLGFMVTLAVAVFVVEAIKMNKGSIEKGRLDANPACLYDESIQVIL